MSDRPVWDNGSWRGFPKLVGDVRADFCVVGLGGSGLAAVDEAIGSGQSVVGIDAGEVAGEAAGRNGGLLLAGLPLFYHRARARWGRAARELYGKTQAELARMMTGHTVRQVGSLRIASSGAELADIEDELAALRGDGFGGEEYTGPEGEGLLISENGVCNPLERCRTEAERLAREGARFFENTRAVGFEAGRVETTAGSVEAQRVVVAIDGRLELTFPDLRNRVRTARLEMLATKPAEPRFARPVHTSFGYTYWQQLSNGVVAMGGMRDRHEDVSWTIEPGTNQDLQRDLEKRLRDLDIDAPITHRWSGHVAFTEDGRPVFDEALPGVWVVGAYSGYGNVLGVVYARAAVRSALAAEKEELL